MVGRIRRVQRLQPRAAQLADALSDRRRTAYAETLLQRSPNVLDPFFWRDALAAMPDHAARLIQFAHDWWNFAWDKGGRVRMASAGLTLAALLVFAIGLVRWWRRIALISRVGTCYSKALAALLVFLRRATATPLGVAVVLTLLDQFELVPPDYRRLLLSLVIGTGAAALARAAATSVLAPDDAARRLVGFDDATSQWLFSHLA